LATITPSESSTSPQGPTNLHPGVPAKSPDSRIAIPRPKLLASVAESSTWDAFRNGPKIDTPESSFLGPTTVTRSAHANCPGCDKSFFGVRLASAPNNTLKSASVK